MGMMNKTKLRRIGWMMVASQLLLMVFTVQWISSQYEDERDELKKSLTKIFTDVQHKVSDSLLITQVIDPIAEPGDYTYAQPTDAAATQKVKLSAQGLHNVLRNAGSISTGQEHSLFIMDTIAFNELFVNELRHNGWNFRSEWVNNSDSDKNGNKIFIKSSFFTKDNGVLVNNYDGYLLQMLLPELLFALVLLVVTAAAFIIAYRSLMAQIKLSHMKDDFISNMSHELKTPIATVKVALEALGNFNAIDNPQLGREYLGMATSEMNRLELLATRVLNTTLLENGKIYLQRETCDLKELVHEAIQSMQIKLDQHEARVTLEAMGGSYIIAADKLHLQGVIVNLLDNSIKYAQGQASIHISLTEANGTVQLAVSDNGPGIPEEYREKVFEKFFRVPTGNRHNTKGYGLGLSYAAQVMRQHNGRINVENIVGGGCVFTLSF